MMFPRRRTDAEFLRDLARTIRRRRKYGAAFLGLGALAALIGPFVLWANVGSPLVRMKVSSEAVYQQVAFWQGLVSGAGRSLSMFGGVYLLVFAMILLFKDRNTEMLLRLADDARDLRVRLDFTADDSAILAAAERWVARRRAFGWAFLALGLILLGYAAVVTELLRSGVSTAVNLNQTLSLMMGFGSGMAAVLAAHLVLYAFVAGAVFLRRDRKGELLLKLAPRLTEAKAAGSLGAPACSDRYDGAVPSTVRAHR